ncbi:hypothetical protein LCGC14_2780280 [marine sediment metagenome]|uniref:Uncharacterized protein n=1 Tax=marine sediment metagenome TaxID=412755 RepID=A0A0F9B294_9ZZZZ
MRIAIVLILTILVSSVCWANNFAYEQDLRDRGFEVPTETGNHFLGHAIVDNELKAIYYCRGTTTANWGDRIAVKQGQYYVYIGGIPPLVDKEKVEAFYKTLQER